MPGMGSSSEPKRRQAWRRLLPKCLCRKQKDEVPQDAQLICAVNVPKLCSKCVQGWSNSVMTSKYTVLTFLPKNLWYQFHVFSNVYFLCMAMLQLVPAISDSNGKPTMLTPLALVLGVTALKDAIEDYRRHRSDAVENSRVAVRLNAGTGQLEKVPWSSLVVGNVVKLRKGDAVPADMVLLSSSDDTGTVYVETKDLDGETNLKAKVCLEETQGLDVRKINAASSARVDDHLCVRIAYEQPTASLYSFSGSIGINNEAPLALSADQLVLRGSSIRTTKYAWGVVVYTGHNTRLMVNSAASSSGRYKLSKLMKMYNTHILQLFALQMFFCAISAVSYALWSNLWQDNWYLERPEETIGTKIREVIEVFGRLVLQFTLFVPISLLTTLEIVKVVQGYIISRDRKMVHGDVKAQTNSAGTADDLGCVTHVFSDKTGTLTENCMLINTLGIMGDLNRQFGPNPHLMQPCDTHVSQKFPTRGIKAVSTGKDEANLRRLLLVLGLCHSVLRQQRDESDSDDGAHQGTPVAGKLNYASSVDTTGGSSSSCAAEDPKSTDDSEDLYDASSPDEMALVAGARELGFEFWGRPSAHNIVMKFTNDWARNLIGHDGGVSDDTDFINYEVLEVLEFDNVRKRMSVMVRSPTTGKVMLLVKGADSTMLEVATSETDSNGLTTYLLGLATQGLRTLVLGVRELSGFPLDNWRARYGKARAAGDTDALSELISEAEMGITIVGATGIEDKLQDHVPETISEIRAAGVSMWILTGDKVETAINIGRSSNLISPNGENFVIQDPDMNEKDILEKLQDISDRGAEPRTVSLTILGDCLATILKSDDLREQFFSVGLTKCSFLYKWPRPLFSKRVLAMWFWHAFYVGGACLIVSTYFSSVFIRNRRGMVVTTLPELSVLVMVVLIPLMNLMIYRWVNSFHWFTTHFLYNICTVLFVAALFILYRFFLWDILFNPMGVAICLMGWATAVLPLIFYHTYMSLFKPDNARIVKERLHMGVHDLVIGKGGPEVGGAAEVLVPNLTAIEHTTTLASSEVAHEAAPRSMRDRVNSTGYAFSESENQDRIGLYAHSKVLQPLSSKLGILREKSPW
ncbi:hypothetical protein FOL46_004941 [Perkinsus olseni]|uniref:Phospholipid-transporting ATPase n=1 Tax=Perkinsus olseni TaxID=32597 RepID=A0A7J6MYS5_PEROL|nr:hypothetical protein FOL46_004941 [Perkinsus olseni]